MSIPETIRDQIGREALFLLRAHALSGNNEKGALSFQIRGSKKVNRIQITLEPTDTYNVKFFKGANLVSSYSDIYVNQLHDIIELGTDLFVSFRRRQPA